MADASFSSSLIVGSALTSFSNCSSGRSGQDLLAVGADHDLHRGVRGRGLGRGCGLLRRGGLLGGGAAFFAGAGLVVPLGGGLLGGGLLRRRGRGLLRGRRGRHAGAGHVDVDRDAEGAQVLEQPLEVPGLDLGVLARPTHVLGTEASLGTLVDQCDDGRVGEHVLRDLARVRGRHEHLFNRDWWIRSGRSRDPAQGAARPAVVKSRAAHSATHEGVPASAPPLDERVAPGLLAGHGSTMYVAGPVGAVRVLKVRCQSSSVTPSMSSTHS